MKALLFWPVILGITLWACACFWEVQKCVWLFPQLQVTTVLPYFFPYMTLAKGFSFLKTQRCWNNSTTYTSLFHATGEPALSCRVTAVLISDPLNTQLTAGFGYNDCSCRLRRGFNNERMHHFATGAIVFPDITGLARLWWLHISFSPQCLFTRKPKQLSYTLATYSFLLRCGYICKYEEPKVQGRAIVQR